MHVFNQPVDLNTLPMNKAHRFPSCKEKIYQETNVSLCLWVLISIIVHTRAIGFRYERSRLLGLSSSPHRRDASRPKIKLTRLLKQ